MSEQVKAAPNGLSNASLFFGVLALLTSITVVLVPFNASLAIMFAWLSRGQKKMAGRAVVGNVMAIISIVIGIATVIALVLAVAGYVTGAQTGGTIPPQLEPYINQIIPYLQQYGIVTIQ